MKKLLIIPIVLLFLFAGCKTEVSPYGASIKGGVGFFTFNGKLSSSYLPGALKYFTAMNIKKVIMEVHSPGGSLYEMWRIVSWMEEYDKIEYETRAYGMAGSASLIIFLAGDKRLVSRYPTFMWHNIARSGAGAELLNKKDNAYIASRTDLSVEEILEKIDNDEKSWYFGAKEAIALGIAHGYIE